MMVEEAEGQGDSSPSRQVVRADSSGARSRVSTNSSRENNRQRMMRRAFQEASIEKEPKISTQTFVFMLIVAGLFDLISLLINLIPAVGGLIDGILITPFATMLFYFWYKKHDVSYSNSSRMAVMVIVPLIEFIPIINALPGWILEVVTIYLSVRAEEKLEN